MLSFTRCQIPLPVLPFLESRTTTSNPTIEHLFRVNESKGVLTFSHVGEDFD